jgi:hypothetical protein
LYGRLNQNKFKDLSLKSGVLLQYESLQNNFRYNIYNLELTSLKSANPTIGGEARCMGWVAKVTPK